jgi:hypothetical protein
MTGRRHSGDSTSISTIVGVVAAAHARRYAVAVALVVLSLLTVVGPHLHQVTVEAASPGIVCRDARDCAVPPQPDQERHQQVPTLVARRTDQLARRVAASADPVEIAAQVAALTHPWTQGYHPAASGLRSQPPERSPDLRAPPLA